MRKQKLITTIGSAVQDVMFYTDAGEVRNEPDNEMCPRSVSFEFPCKINSDNVEFMVGGGAINTATSFASFGLPTACFTAVGDDAAGKHILDHLDTLGIDRRGAQVSKTMHTGLSFVVTLGKSSEHVLFAYRGASGSLSISEADLRKIKSQWIYINTVAGSWRVTLNKIFDSAVSRGIDVAWNPGWRQLEAGYAGLKKYFERTHVLLVNADEARDLLVSAKKSVKGVSVRKLVKLLHAFGQKITVITAGSKGAYVYDGRKTYDSKVKKVKVINTTGAGDAFGAGFVTGLMRSGDISKALRVGIHNSAGVITRTGATAGILSKKKIEALLR